MSKLEKVRKLELNMLNRLHTFSGLKQEDIRDLFMALAYEMIVDYRNGHTSTIPCLGELKLVYCGDSLRADGLMDAKVEVQLDLSQDMIRAVGQIVDGEESDIEKRQMNKIINFLSNKLDIPNE